MSIFSQSIFGGTFDPQRVGVLRDNALWRTELRLGELALAFVCSEEANTHCDDAVAVLSEKRIQTLGALVDILPKGNFPFQLRPFGRKGVDSALLTANLEDFLRELLWDAARISAGTMTRRFELTEDGAVSAAEHDAVVVLAAAKRALSLIDASRWGFAGQAAILTGLVLELAGLSQRRTTDDVDGARSAAVRRTVARAQRRQH